MADLRVRKLILNPNVSQLQKDVLKKLINGSSFHSYSHTQPGGMYSLTLKSAIVFIQQNSEQHLDEAPISETIKIIIRKFYNMGDVILNYLRYDRRFINVPAVRDFVAKELVGMLLLSDEEGAELWGPLTVEDMYEAEYDEEEELDVTTAPLVDYFLTRIEPLFYSPPQADPNFKRAIIHEYKPNLEPIINNFLRGVLKTKII